MQINNKVQNNKLQTEITSGFIGGLNTFQDQTLIRDTELTEAKNIVLEVDGIEPRYGTINYGDNGSDSAIYGAIGYYKSDGTRKFLRISGANLRYLNNGVWTDIGSTAYSNIRTDMIQVRDAIYTFNGTDALTKYDGSTITTYSALTTPAGLTVAATGGTGAVAYSYRVSAFNAVGETLACTAVAISNGVATLSATTYNKLDWTATAGATGYNIWGRKATGLGETYLTTVYTNTFNDTGTYDPSSVILPSEGNNTTGIKGKFACFAISRIFVAGDSSNPSRLYWGGVGTNIDNFSGSETGGGYTDVYKNDGAIIRAIIPFQGGVIVGKDNAIYKFTFTDAGLPRLEEITRSFGMISHFATKHVENDVIFPASKNGRLAFYSLGNQENYTSSVLRTNELSIKIASMLTNVNLARLQNAEGFYFRNIYGCAITKDGSSANDRIWCLDTRFGAWYYWESLPASGFNIYNDGTNEDLFYWHNTSGYMNKMFQSTRSDNSSAISVKFATKAYNEKQFQKYKKYYDPVFQFKNVSTSGNIMVDIITDGVIIAEQFTINSYVSRGLGVGASLIGAMFVGDARGGTPTGGESSDQVVEKKLSLKSRSIKYSFTSSTANITYKLLSIAHDFKILDKRLPQSSISY